MPPSPFRSPAAGLLLALGYLTTAAPVLSAEAPPEAARSPRDFLASPRETVKTLYYAAVAYDIQPQLADEAAACLDLDPARADDPAETVRLAIELEQTLRILCMPLHGVPEKTDRDNVCVYDADGFRICLGRGADGLWRFDRATTERIPAM